MQKRLKCHTLRLRFYDTRTTTSPNRKMNITLTKFNRKSESRSDISLLLTWNLEPKKIVFQIVEFEDDSFDLEIVNAFWETYKLLNNEELDLIYSFVSEYLSNENNL